MIKNNQKKILFLSHYGANSQFQDFFSEIAKNPNYEVKVIIPNIVEYQNGYRSQNFPVKKTTDNVEYIPARLFNKKKYYLSGYIPELPATILKFKPDIVIVTDEVYTLDTWFVILYKLLFLKRYQIISWSQAHYMNDNKILKQFERTLFLWNRKFVHKFIARNKHQENKISKNLNNNEYVQHVYWSTNPDKFTKLSLNRNELMQKLNISIDLENKKIIGFVGRVVSEKGVFNIVKALKKLPPNSIFLILGQGNNNYIQEIKTYIQNNELSKQCFFLKDKNYRDLVYFYNLIDLLILPTTNLNKYYELFGRVLPECMMCKTLVLGSTNGAIPEVINNEKCIFEQNDQEKMINQIKYLLELSDADKNITIEKNYNHAINNFTVKTFVKNLIAITEK